MQTGLPLPSAGDDPLTQLSDQSHIPQAGLDLTHLNVALAPLAQFHAASLVWKQSLQVKN